MTEKKYIELTMKENTFSKIIKRRFDYITEVFFNCLNGLKEFLINFFKFVFAIAFTPISLTVIFVMVVFFLKKNVKKEFEQRNKHLQEPINKRFYNCQKMVFSLLSWKSLTILK